MLKCCYDFIACMKKSLIEDKKGKEQRGHPHWNPKGHILQFGVVAHVVYYCTVVSEAA